MGAPHRSGAYQAMSRQVVLAARANPLTRCWRCSLLLHEHRPHKNGRQPFWTAGHVVDSDPGSPLLPEASTCNFKAGGLLAAQRRLESTRRW
jgi:hypothetical protein